MAIRDALAFREHRHKLFPASAESEQSLEIAEGVPEYTGVVAAMADVTTAHNYTADKLTNPDLTVSLVRSFAYTSGPPYGLLLDQRLPGWRKNLTAQSDLGKLLASTMTGPPASPEERSSIYGVTEIRAYESDRAKKIKVTKARYRKYLVDGPTLTLPPAGQMNFNPSNLISLDDMGAVYPTFHASGDWGALNVTDGALLPTDFSRIAVSAPTKNTGAHLEGHGWTLDLQPKWHAVLSGKSKN